MSAPKFPLGRVVATPNALANVPPQAILEAIGRHHNGDWGTLSKEDRDANEDALKVGSRLLSAYHEPNGTKFWIITEADRSVTTILLPEDY